MQHGGGGGYGVGMGGMGGVGVQMGLDRPFKCDLCPQSFNRNHDLKRHKRIHLAVKPYPCGECEKSFSRKDALKVCFFFSFLFSSSFSVCFFGLVL
jgi:hypothetical protein